MSRGRDDDENDRFVWLYLRDAGGWHSAREMADALVLDARGKMRLAWSLRRLLAGGHLVQRTGAHGVERYGVTALCWPYPGETMEPAPALPPCGPDAAVTGL